MRLAQKWSLLLLKPDLVAHPPLLKEALKEILAAGVTIAGVQKTLISPEKAAKLYGIHREKFFYNRLVRHITSGPVIALRVRGEVRSFLGSSRLWPLGEMVTLRQKLALSDVRNVAHNSDAETAETELSFFEPFLEPEPVLSAILAEDEEQEEGDTSRNKFSSYFCTILTICMGVTKN